jgi:cell fate regulator YaaT (PSP1 superfamily)
MKMKKWFGALAFVALIAPMQFACSSKQERKAEEVQEEYKDVVDAQQEGDTSDIREEQAELDSARQDYRETAKDSTR